jgi:CspA family cold shock protein
MARGTVKWFNAEKGIAQDEAGASDVFVHYSSVEGSGFKELAEGEAVTFDVQQGRKGLEAARVVRG